VDGRLRQQQVYLDGVFGRTPRVSTDLTRLEAEAERVMRPDAFAYIAGGAGTGATMRANRAAFDRHRIVPRMLRDASRRDTTVELFGRRLASPFLLAPIGVAEMAHADADLATARAAAAEGVPMVFSNQASVPMERVAAELGDTPRWFQLYWSTSNELVESLVARAEACGCEAIVVTLDTTLLGWRTRDLDIGFLPFLRGMGIAQYTSDPVFQRLVKEAGAAPRTPVDVPSQRPTPSALRVLMSLRKRRISREEVQRFTEIYSRPSLSWDDLPFLRERTTLPILLKGVCHPDDARRALDAEIDGLIVSNHGGRQVDGAIATLDALPAVAEAVGGRVPVLMDSGIRGGADVFKALALGARAVLLGRPYIYALALAGERGVRQVLRDLSADFDLTLGLAGYSAAADVGPEALVATPG
jgi:isopentenyl diphosphate isomerase/L-lactate dehydrogenase-like FMN-dependent dehydrogenase